MLLGIRFQCINGIVENMVMEWKMVVEQRIESCRGIGCIGNIAAQFVCSYGHMVTMVSAGHITMVDLGASCYEN